MPSLRAAASAGIRYQLILKTSTVLMNQVATVVLARLLLPEDFGLVAVATIVVGFLTGVADFGLGVALIQGGWQGKPDYETGATLRLVLASIATVATLAVAPIIAVYYGETLLLWIIWALSPLILLNFLGFVSRVSLTRELKFKKAVTPDILGRLSSSIVAILAAIAGFSFWSLVIGPVVGAIIGSVGLYIVRPWTLSVSFDLHVARKLLRFGITVLTSNLLMFVFTSIGMLVLATIGLSELGYFSMAYAWGVAIPLSFHNTLDNVMFPVYASVAREPARLQYLYLKTLRYLLWFMMPISFLLSAVAAHLVSVLLGPTWLPAALGLQILAVAGVLLVVSFSYQSAVIAGGNARENLSITAIACGFMVFLGPLATLEWGGVGLSVAFLAVAGSLVAIVSQRTVRVLQVEPASLKEVWLPALVSSGAMYLVLSVLGVAFPPSVASLAAQVCVGILVYFSLIRFLTGGRFLAVLREGVSTLLSPGRG